MKRTHTIILILLLAVLAISSCRTKYTLMKTTNTTTPTTRTLTVKEIVKQHSTANSEILYLNISDAEAKYKNEEKSYSVKMTIKIIKDKEINISVFPLLGIELFRLRFTPERFYIFDKFNRQYCDNSYQYFSKMLKTEVSYKDIEALLTNKLFSLDHTTTIDEAYTSTQLEDRFLLTSKQNFNNYKHIFEISPDYMLSSTILKDVATDALKVDYSMFKAIDKILFPTTIELKTDLPKDNFELKIDVKKIEINKAFETNSIDFNRYSKVECSQIF